MTIYVSPTGSDTGKGTTDDPVRTVTRGCELGSDVAVAPGEYPATTVTQRRDEGTRVYAYGAVIAGLRVKGAAHLRWHGGRFQGGNDGIVVEARQSLSDTATDLYFESFDCIGNGTSGSGIKVQNGTSGARFRDFTCTDLWTGVSGPGRVSAEWGSSQLLFERFTIERMISDGFQFGDWHNVTIRDGVFRDIQDVRANVPDGSRAHNDCIQLTGRCSSVAIYRVLATTASSFVLSQPAIGPINDLEVSQCEAVNQFSVSIQSQNTTGAIFRDLVLNGQNGGLWLRGYQGKAATDTIVQRVIALSTKKPADGFKEIEGAQAVVKDGIITT